MSPINLPLLVIALLLLLGIVASKAGGRFGLPALLTFIVVGMFAGDEGPGGITFDNYAAAQTVGVVALAFILYGGGLDTRWRTVRPVLTSGLLLATIGVAATTVAVGLAAYALLGIPFLECLLVGAVVSSTDASAVFSVFREQAVDLERRVKALLEFESGSNDPMAVFLTIGLTALLTNPDFRPISMITLFVQQMVVGGALGYVLGRLAVRMINALRLRVLGLYSVTSIAIVLFVYGATALLGGSGFLAVYVTGIVIGNSEMAHKRSIMHFQDGITWLMEIAMFLTLGLLVNPSQLLPIALPALGISLFLIFIGRPLAVMLTLWRSDFPQPARLFASWVGLRGAVPIVLATFPLLAGVEHADVIFRVAFFIVLTSMLIQGTTLTWVAGQLGLATEALTETERAMLAAARETREE
jgi:cell volume regulation protein A